MSVIRFLDGPMAGKTVALTKPRLTIGREPTNDIPINDPAVSRQHAALVQGGPTGWMIEKLNPQNIVSINGREVNQSPINNNDRVTLGSVSFQYLGAGAVGMMSTMNAPQGAAAVGTINYEIVTRIGPRVPRRYVGEAS